MRLFAIFFLLITAINSFAQEDHVLFKYAPLAMLDEVSFPTVQTGVEVSLSPQTSWYNEFGIRYRKASNENVDTNFVSTTGFKIKSEFRYYFSGLFSQDVERLWGWYTGINIFYTRTTNNTNINYYYQKDSTKACEDNFGVRKRVWGTNLILGRQSDIGERFRFDIYGGLGIRFSDFATVAQQFDSKHDSQIKARHPNVYVSKGAAAAEGERRTRLNFTFGIRFAYKLY
jgi:hypothetical protein